MQFFKKKSLMIPMGHCRFYPRCSVSRIIQDLRSQGAFPSLLLLGVWG